MSFKGTLLFALNAVSLTLIFLSHIAPPITAALESTLTSGRDSPDLSVRMRRGYSPRTLERGIFEDIRQLSANSLRQFLAGPRWATLGHP